MMKKISIVVPVYNEVESIDSFIKEINNLKINHEIIFSCDPSNDGTEEKLKMNYQLVQKVQSKH